MTSKEAPDRIWKIADTLRGREFTGLGSLVSECKDQGIAMTVNDLAFMVSRASMSSRFRLQPDHFVPQGVADFIAKLIKPYSPTSILDPWAGMGFLPIPLNELLKPKRYDAYSQNHGHAEVWRQLEGTAGITLHETDALVALADSSDTFGAAVSCPPWGLRANQSVTVRIGDKDEEIKEDYGHLLILEACRHLTERGVGDV